VICVCLPLDEQVTEVLTPLRSLDFFLAREVNCSAGSGAPLLPVAFGRNNPDLLADGNADVFLDKVERDTGRMLCLVTTLGISARGAAEFYQ